MQSTWAWDDEEHSDLHALEALEFDCPSMAGGATLAGHPIDPGHVLVIARGARRALARVVLRPGEPKCGGLALHVFDAQGIGREEPGPLLLSLAELSVMDLRWPSAHEVRCLLSAETAALL